MIVLGVQLRAKMQCPICLEDLDQALVFSCGHSCCSPCYTASEITTCPYCRQAITTTTPAPWLNCRSSSYSDPSEASDSLEINQIADIRGHELVRSAALLRAKMSSVVSKIGIILKDRDDGIKRINEHYQSELNKIAISRDRAMAQLAQNTQVQLDQDETNVKSQEYNNQDLEHLALTCMALSTQTSQVLNQALPIHQPRIRKLLFEWPFGITPSRPQGRLPHRLRKYIYVEGPDICIQVDGKTIFYEEMDPADRSKHIRYEVTFTDYPNVKAYDGKIYVLIQNSSQATVFVFDSRLKHIDTIDPQLSKYDKVKDFYMDQGKLQFVYEPLACGRTYASLHGKLHEIYTINVTNAEVVGDTLYLRDYDRVILIQHNDNKFIDPRNQTTTTFNNSRFFVSNDKVYIYNRNSSNTFVRLLVDNGEMLVYKGPSTADYIPWARNTILMIEGEKATLLKLD